MIPEDFNFRPNKSELGFKTKIADGAQFAWFSPVEEPEHRLRYAVIKEEAGVLQILPTEGRFKKGLDAWRFADEEAEEHTVWTVAKVRPNRIDLVKKS
ncbi:MAG TPA: hypothetical protein PKA37_15405 [Planctomycetota bacterium]|jgi:hypothetical protein|nr:hypothetical protein [Planctomycetota bacterium]